MTDVAPPSAPGPSPSDPAMVSRAIEPGTGSAGRESSSQLPSRQPVLPTPSGPTQGTPAVTLSPSLAALVRNARLRGVIAGRSAEGLPLLRTDNGTFVIEGRAALPRGSEIDLRVLRVGARIEAALLARDGRSLAPPPTLVLTPSERPPALGYAATIAVPRPASGPVVGAVSPFTAGQEVDAQVVDQPERVRPEAAPRAGPRTIPAAGTTRAAPAVAMRPPSPPSPLPLGTTLVARMLAVLPAEGPSVATDGGASLRDTPSPTRAGTAPAAPTPAAAPLPRHVPPSAPSPPSRHAPAAEARRHVQATGGIAPAEASAPAVPQPPATLESRAGAPPAAVAGTGAGPPAPTGAGSTPPAGAMVAAEIASSPLRVDVVAVAVGRDLGGRLLLRTPLGLLRLETEEPLAIGTRYIIEVNTRPAPQSPGRFELEPGSAFKGVSRREWPALEEAIAALQEARPALAGRLARSLPAPTPARLENGLLFFLTALRFGDVSSWLGPEIVRGLDQLGRQELVRRMSEDFTRIGQMAERAPTAGEWRTLLVPFFDAGRLQHLRLSWRGRERGEAGDDADGAGARFVVDLSLGRLGQMQIDGLFLRPRFDLVVRHEAVLAETTRDEITRLFQQGLGASGLAGRIVFRAEPPQPLGAALDPLAETGGGVFA